MKKTNQSETATLRQHAEEKMRSKQAKSSSPLTEAETQKLIHELEVHQIELEMQNDELLLAREQAVAATEKLTDLYDFAPSGYFTLSRQGEIIQLNLCGAAMLGKERSRLINRLFLFFVSPETKPIFNLFFDKLFSNKTKETCDVTLNIAGNKPEYIHLTGIVSSDNNQCFITAVDITTRRQAEELLSENEEKYRLLYTSMDQGLALHEIITDENGKPVDYVFLDINESYTRLLGVTREMSIGKRIREVMPKVEQYWIDIFGKVALTGESSYYENYLETTGKYYSTYSYCPKKNQFAVLVNDITERKQFQMALQESQNRLNEAHKLAHIGVWDWDAKTDTVIWSSELYQIAGLDPQLPAPTYAEQSTIYTPQSWNKLQNAVNKTMQNGDEYHLELDLIRSDGIIRNVNAFGGLKFDSMGKIAGLFGTLQDITERKLSESIFRDIIEKNPMSIQILNMEGYTIQTNKAHNQIFGVNPPSDYSIFKDAQLEQQGFGNSFEQIKKGEIVYFPDSYYNVRDVDPSFPDFPVWVKGIGFTLNNINGIPDRIVLMHENITERKHAEALLNDIIEKNPMSIQIVDKEGYTLRGNPAYYKLFGAIPPPDFSIFDDLQRKSKELEQLVKLAKSGEVVHLPDIYFNAHDEVSGAPDIPLWIRALIFPLNDSGGKPERFVFIHENITKSKLAEEEIIKMGQHYQALIEKAPDGVALLNAEGNFKYISPSAKKMFGYNQMDEVSGNPAEYTHPDDLQLVLTELGKIFEDASYIPTLEYRFIDKQGRWHWVETTFSNLLANSSVESIVLNFRDITERKQLEGVQNFLLTCGYLGSDENFFESLAKYLSEILDSEYVCIDKLEGDGLTAQTVAIYNLGKFDANISYTLKQTPCGDVVGKTICCFPENVCQLFPHDEALQELKAHSYIGTTLWSFDGKPIGLIAIIGQKPMNNTAFAENVLKLVAIRAAGELERKQVEDELRSAKEKAEENEIRFRSLFQNMNNSASLYEVITNNQGIPCDYRFLDVNAFYEKSLGFKASYLIGKTLLEVFPDTELLWLDTIKEVVLTSNPTTLESYSIELDMYFELIVYVPQKGKMAMIGSNITERKRNELELIAAKEKAEESEAKYKQIFDNTFDIMAIYEVTEDRRFKVITFNPAEAKLIGPVEYYQNRYIDDCIPPELYNDFKQHYESCITEEKLIVYEENISFQDIHKTFYTQLIPLKNIEGRVHRIIVISRDITDNRILQTQLLNQNDKLKLLNLDLIASKEKAEESDRLKSAFLANMSHEIRTPMNGILGFSELLKEPGLTGDQQQEYIRIIEKSGIRMLNIINDIIDISKIEAGLMKIDLRETKINEKIEFLHTFFKPEVEAKGMKLLFKNALPANEAIIKTDSEKLFAILTNLVKNAIKFTNTGSIEFGYYLTVETHGRTSLRFFVKDTGIGIAKNRQEAIFERFIQADIADKMARQGAGLGLAISKSYVEMLGGKIWVESEVGIGSNFYFTLPYQIKLKEEINTKQEVVTPNDEIQMKKLKILIVEDDESSSQLISIGVQKISREIIKVQTGTEAVEACRNNPDIELILMDIQLPEMDGYDATRQIREFNPELIIIAQTAYALSGDREKAIEAGCTDYISKPIRKEELEKLIQKYFL